MTLIANEECRAMLAIFVGHIPEVRWFSAAGWRSRFSTPHSVDFL